MLPEKPLSGPGAGHTCFLSFYLTDQVHGRQHGAFTLGRSLSCFDSYYVCMKLAYIS